MNLGLETGKCAPDLIAAIKPIAQAARLWSMRKLAKGTMVFAPGDTTGEIVLLLSGLVKLVYNAAEGEAWIKSFIIDQGVFSASDAFGDTAAASYGAECLETIEFVRLPRSFVQTALQASPELRLAQQAFSTWVLSRKQMREAALLTLSPQARYFALLQTSSAILDRLPQGDIARFIGITPIAFSRIKRRFAAAGG
jgi:CRP-like cAMP-binding protein